MSKMAKLGPRPDSPATISFRLFGAYQQTAWQNTVYVAYSGALPSANDLNQLSTSLATAWNTNIAPVMTTQTHLKSITATDLSSRNGAIGNWTGDHPGTEVGTQFVPANVALCISWNINRRFRGGHPRMYLPPPYATNMLNGNIWDPTYQTNAHNALIAFHNALSTLTYGGATCTHIAVSWVKSSGSPPVQSYNEPPIKDVISNVTVHSRIDSMRRRTGKELP